MPDEVVLQDKDRQKLDGIVQQMTTNKESDADIQAVVNDFKSKYGTVKKKEAAASSSGSAPTLEQASELNLKFPLGQSSASTSKLATQNNFTPTPIKRVFQATSFLDRDIAVQQATSLRGIEEMQRQKQQQQDPTSIKSIEAQQQEKSALRLSFDEKANQQKNEIISDPNKLKEYRETRQKEIDDNIASLKNKQSQMTGGEASVSVNRGAYANIDTPEYQQLNTDIDDATKYKDELKKSVAQVASVSIPATIIKNGLPIDVKDIGRRVLDVMGESVKDDDEVLAALAQPNIENVNTRFGVMQQEKYDVKDIDKTKQFIEFNREQVGTDAMANYWDYNRKQAYDAAPQKIDEFKRLNAIVKGEALDGKTFTPDEQLNARRSLNDLLQDPLVQKYAQADAETKRYVNISDKVVDNYPQVKRNQLRQLYNDAFFEVQKDWEEETNADPFTYPRKLVGWIFGETPSRDEIKEIAKRTNHTEKEVQSIINEGGFFKDVPHTIRINGLLQGVASGANSMLVNAKMGAKRFLDVDNVETENRISSINLESKNLMAQRNKLIDDSGKFNFNPQSIFNTMGSGIGQTTMLALPTLVTGGIVGEAALATKLIEGGTTVASGYISSYEDGYKQAAKETDNEQTRRDYANFYGLVNALPELYLSPADILKKIGGKAGANTLFEAFMKDGAEGTAKASLRKTATSAAKEGLNVIAAEEGEELSTTLAEAYGKDKYLGIKTSLPQLITELQQTAIMTAITTLPLAVGAGVGGNVDASGVRKEALFEVGNEPELYKQKLQKPLDEGKISQDEYNKKASVINTMSNIVAGVNTVTKNNGKPLSYDEKVAMAGEQYRILVNTELAEKTTIEAQKKQAEADTAEAMKAQGDILNKPDFTHNVGDEVVVTAKDGTVLGESAKVTAISPDGKFVQTDLGEAFVPIEQVQVKAAEQEAEEIVFPARDNDFANKFFNEVENKAYQLAEPDVQKQMIADKKVELQVPKGEPEVISKPIELTPEITETKIKFPLPSKPVTEMTSAELNEHAKQIKDYQKKTKLTEERENNLSEEEANEYFGKNLPKDGVYDPIEIQRIANRVEAIEQAEIVQDIAATIKRPLIDFARKQDAENLAVIKAAQRKAAELGIDGNEMIKQVFEEVKGEFGGDAKEMMKVIVDAITPKAEQPKLKEPTTIVGNEALRDVESTVKALEENADFKLAANEWINLIPKSFFAKGKSLAQTYAEAYHGSKTTPNLYGKNEAFVKAVESLLSKEQTKNEAIKPEASTENKQGNKSTEAESKPTEKPNEDKQQPKAEKKYVDLFKALDTRATAVREEAVKKTGANEKEVLYAKYINSNFEEIVKQLKQNNKIEKKC